MKQYKPMKLPKETEEEQMATVKRMKKRNKKLLFDVCPVCQTWAVMLPNMGGMHPICWDKNRRKRNPVADKNQGSFI